MDKNSRHRILDGALDLLRTEGGGKITLDATAKQVGLTKPGLMYHFPTKEALMLAVVDHVAARWEKLLLFRLGQPPKTATAHQRIRAYVQVSLTEHFDRADFAIYSDAHYLEAFGAAWVRRLEPWLYLPDTLAPADRARLTAARLLADGYWTAAATNVFPVPETDRAHLLAVAEELLAEESANPPEGSR